MFKLLGSLFNWGSALQYAHTLRQDPEKRAKTKYFGAHSIGHTLAALCCGFFIWLALWCIQSGSVLLLITGIVFGLAGVVGIISSLFKSILYFILQITMNRKAFTWITLVILIIGIGGGAGLIAWLISTSGF